MIRAPSHAPPTRAASCRVVVLRALPGLGGMLCAGPALRSLRAGMAEGGHLALVALPGTEPMAAHVLPLVGELIPSPAAPASRAAEPDPPWPAFEAAMRPHGFDLALQMQGDGSHVDAFMPRLAAARTAGYLPAGRDGDADWPPCSAHGHEIERWTAWS